MRSKILDQLVDPHGWSEASHLPLRLSSLAALANDESYSAAVRAICSAPVALFDVEANDPAVLLLLGIRAVVRRGVTLVTAHHAGDQRFWASVPFNIKDLNPISTLRGASIQIIAKAISEGLAKLRANPKYLDLPAYDAVRDLGVDPSDYNPRLPAHEVLLLRPFTDAYRVHHLELVRRVVGDALELDQAKIRSIIDEESPRLAGQRLYEAIRTTMLCVVDLSGWRANVLFEVGVRLACQPRPPVFVLDRDFPHTTDKAVVEALERRLQPAMYAAPGAGSQIRKRLDQWRRQDDVENATFTVAKTFFDIRQEPSLSPVSATLFAEAQLALRLDAPQEKVDPLPLFARGNEAMSNGVSASGLDRLVAAWAQLDSWHDPASASSVSLLDPQFRELFRRYTVLGTGLRQQLERLRSPGAVRLLRLLYAREDVDTFKRLKEFDSMLAELDRARDNRRQLPLKVQGDARPATIGLLQLLDGDRITLMNEVGAIGGRTADLLLQALTLDGVILSRMMKKINGGV
jgi:hypothetical protein